MIKPCELEGRAVVEHSSSSKEAEIFRNPAKAIIKNDVRVIPAPMNNPAELETMYRQHPVKMMFFQVLSHALGKKISSKAEPYMCGLSYFSRTGKGEEACFFYIPNILSYVRHEGRSFAIPVLKKLILRINPDPGRESPDKNCDSDLESTNPFIYPLSKYAYSNNR